MIDVVEVSYRLVKVKQQKYVCRCGGCVETALGPARALSGSRYSRAFAIKVIVDKWLDHIPLERQVRIRERHGLIVTSQTLWDLAYAFSQRLAIVDEALGTHEAGARASPASCSLDAGLMATEVSTRRCQTIPTRSAHSRGSAPSTGNSQV
jgi:hypothetical protein